MSTIFFSSFSFTESVYVALNVLICVSDEVEAPVLTVNSNWSRPDPCSFTCKGSHIIISSIYNSSNCSPEEDTSPDNYTLNLNCSDDHIMCNHSNPVSWKTDRKKVNELCTVNKGIYHIHSHMKKEYECENVTKHWCEMPVSLKFRLGKLIIFVLSFM